MHKPLSLSLSLMFTIIVITSRRNDIFSVPINHFYHLSEDLLCSNNRQDWYSPTVLGRETSQSHNCEGNARNFLAKTKQNKTKNNRILRPSSHFFKARSLIALSVNLWRGWLFFACSDEEQVFLLFLEIKSSQACK